VGSANSDCGPEGPDRNVRPSFSDWYSARRHSVLFLSLLVGLILAPIMQEHRLGGRAVESLYLIILTAAAGGIDSLRGGSGRF
jgi:hypothetical protein